MEQVTVDSMEAPLSIVFVRHGQADTQQAHSDLGPSLSKLGKRQATRVSKRLAHETFDHVYASTLNRARETAQAIMKHHEHTHFTLTRDLHEVSHYHFTSGPIPRKRAIKDTVAFERAAMERVAGHLVESHGSGQKILVVCHGNIIRSIIPLLSGRMPKRSVIMDINNTAVTVLERWESGDGILRLANCVAHLQPDQVT